MALHQSLFIIPIFLPHQGCPHQCTFCNQATISGNRPKLPSVKVINREIIKYLTFKKDKKKPVQIAFYGGNFLGLPLESIKQLLNEAEKFIAFGDVESIRFSTRPDTINNPLLDMIQQYTISTIELGVQSMDDHVLALSNRGHTAQDTTKAVTLIKQRNMQLGLQMMTGLPGDDENRALATTHQIAEFSPNFVRIYPTIVLSGSPLARLYKNGKYAPMSLQESVSLVTKIYTIFSSKQIPVIRIGLQASHELNDKDNILAGPYHPAFGHMVFSEIFLQKAENQLKLKNNLAGKRIEIQVHSRSISKMRGLNNQNIKILKKKFLIESIAVVSDKAIPEDQLSIRIMDTRE